MPYYEDDYDGYDDIGYGYGDRFGIDYDDGVEVFNSDTSNTYWDNCGTHQAAADALEALIPPQGEVENASENPALEKFRRAVNCYYDLWNNGLCNRRREFSSVFGITGTTAAQDPQQLDRVMDQIILDACREQGIEVEADNA